MSESDGPRGAEALAALPRLPRDHGGPVFAEPWQAEAFALAVQLSERGHFTWKEWAAALADELDRAARRGEPDDGSRYYEHWLATLERLVAAKNLAEPTALLTRKMAWATAYRSTPHGQAVELLHDRRPSGSWVGLGFACTVATYWLLQQTAVAPIAEPLVSNTWHVPDEGSLLPVGFAASAGFGTLLGMRHALEPDHLAAVSTLMTGERGSAKATWLGACWGLGHTCTLLTTGALLVILQAEMPTLVAEILELCVILLLVGFGARAIYLGAAGLPARQTHTHRSRGAFSRLPLDRWTLARPLLVGAVHGLAGSGAMTALVVTTLPTTAARIGFLMLFGVGTTLGMALLSGLLGWPIARLGTDHVFTRVVSIAVGGVSTALGLFWASPLVAQFF